MIILDFRIVIPSFLFCQMILLEVILSPSILLQGLILRNSLGRNCQSNTSMKTNSELKCYTYSCFIRWKREQVSHFCHQPSISWWFCKVLLNIYLLHPYSFPLSFGYPWKFFRLNWIFWDAQLGFIRKGCTSSVYKGVDLLQYRWVQLHVIIGSLIGSRFSRLVYY